MRKEGRGMVTVVTMIVIIETTTTSTVTRMTTMIIKNVIKYDFTQIDHKVSYVNFVLLQFKNARKPYNFRESFNA